VSQQTANDEACQVDFYLLGDTSLEAGRLACRLAMMAWERQQKIFIVAATDKLAGQMDELLWRYPEGRFLPHAGPGDPDPGASPVTVVTVTGLNPADVVINLCPEAVPEPERFSRVLEIVPFADDERQASRMKYKTYRDLGITPRTHEINK